ncbi:MAG: nuclease-related domain-containing protein [Ghiorsea sp.]|nr:nuclease-related domain-containing protein [Ghiorsea sp.]
MNIESILFDALMPMATFLLAVFFVFAGFKLYQPTIIGWLGERKVQGILNSLDAKAYTHFHNVLLPMGGETTQIDHVLIVGDTCFVIETKAHGGWIFGAANAKNWIQQFNKRAKFPFQNPIRQNYKHILALKQYIQDLKVVGVVVFTRATLKSPRIDGVLYSKALKSFILKHDVNKTFDNTASIQALQKAMITNKAEHQAHVRRLQAKHGGR